MVVEERGWKRVASETRILAPEQAREYAIEHNKLPHSPTERTLEPDRIKRIQDILGSDRAIAFNWAMVNYGGKVYRMNGQHSSRAILEFKGQLPEELAFHVDSYQADNKEAMANLFQQHDARWSARTKADVSGAFQGLNDGIDRCDRQKAKFAVEGVAWYRRQIEKIPVVGGDDLYRLFFEEGLHPFIQLADEVLTIKTPEMKRAPILGAMYGTFNQSESGSRLFWGSVASYKGSDDSEPAAVLSADLVRDKDKDKDVRGNKLKPGELYAKCIKAWNAFRANEKVRNLSVNLKKGLPEIAA